MDTKKAKQVVALALDVCGGRGRFTLRDVAEDAYRRVKYDDLSQTDQREVMISYLMGEARSQAKAPLRQDFKEDAIRKLPAEYWPIVEKLTRTIYVAGTGGAAYHVMTSTATVDDWNSFLGMADVMAQRARSARNTGRNIRNLLLSEGKTTLHELLTGKKPHMMALTGDK